MNNRRILSLCQLAFKSSNVSLGDRLVASIQSNDAKLVVVSSECGQNRLKKLKDKTSFYKVDLLIFDSIWFDQITHKSLSAFAITDAGFAKAIRKEMERTGVDNGKNSK